MHRLFLDSSNIAIKVRTGSRYTREEIIERSIMISLSAATGFLVTNLKNPQTWPAWITLFVASSTLGLAVAHIPSFYRLFKKRSQINKQYEDIKNDIMKDVCLMPEIQIAQVRAVIDKINKISLAKIVETLLYKITCSKNLHNKIKNRDIEVINLLQSRKDEDQELVMKLIKPHQEHRQDQTHVTSPKM